MASHRAPRAHDNAEGPVDLSSVRADDALLDAIGRAESQADLGNVLTLGDEDQRQLTAVLLAWRRDIDSETTGELVSVEEASSAVASGSRARQRPRLRTPWAVAAALVVVMFGGLAVAAHDATPGDALWGVSKVFFSERAASVEAASAARTRMDQASEALASGRFADARDALSAVDGQLPEVRNEDGSDDLRARARALQAALRAPSPAPSTGKPGSPSSSGSGRSTSSSSSSDGRSSSSTTTSTTTMSPTKTTTPQSGESGTGNPSGGSTSFSPRSVDSGTSRTDASSTPPS